MGLNQQARVMRLVQSDDRPDWQRVVDMAGNAGYARQCLKFALDGLREADAPNAITMIEHAIERLGRDA